MINTVVFDLDGTIYFGDELTAYANEAVSYLQQNGYNILFLTNNSTKTRQEIVDKLKRLGIQTDRSRVYASAYVTASFIKQEKINKVFVIGSEGLKNEINSFGIDCCSESECEAIVIGLDMCFDYNKISMALDAIENGCDIFACNADSSYPVEGGKLKPGCGAMVGAIEASGKKICKIIGKPNIYILEMICNDWNLTKDNIVIVGDSEESDIAMANCFGSNSFLVGKYGCTFEDFLNKIKNREFK